MPNSKILKNLQTLQNHTQNEFTKESNSLSYLIISPNLYPTSPLEFQQKLREIFSKYKINFACFREKEQNKTDIESNLITIQNLNTKIAAFCEICKEFKITALLNLGEPQNSLKYALKYDCGIHLGGAYLEQIPKLKAALNANLAQTDSISHTNIAPDSMNFIESICIESKSTALDSIDSIESKNPKKRHEIFYSAHTLSEIKKADKLGANGITISPIFEVKNKNAPLGLEFLEKISPKDYTAKIFALGGINSQERAAQIKKSPIKNFAGITYFLK